VTPRQAWRGVTQAHSPATRACLVLIRRRSVEPRRCWPHPGRTTALNAATCCPPLNSIPPVHQPYGLVADVLVSLYGSEGHSNTRLRSAGVRLKPGLCLRADVGGHRKPGISRRSSDAASLARHGSPMKQGKVSMVKTRLAQWVSRWRERRLAREQKRQTSATRQATRDVEAQRYHSTGHGP
jgi:hypothetical protein